MALLFRCCSVWNEIAARAGKFTYVPQIVNEVLWWTSQGTFLKEEWPLSVLV